MTGGTGDRSRRVPSLPAETGEYQRVSAHAGGETVPDSQPSPDACLGELSLSGNRLAALRSPSHGKTDSWLTSQVMDPSFSAFINMDSAPANKALDTCTWAQQTETSPQATSRHLRPKTIGVVGTCSLPEAVPDSQPSQDSTNPGLQVYVSQSISLRRCKSNEVTTSASDGRRKYLKKRSGYGTSTHLGHSLQGTSSCLSMASNRAPLADPELTQQPGLAAVAGSAPLLPMLHGTDATSPDVIPDSQASNNEEGSIREQRIPCTSSEGPRISNATLRNKAVRRSRHNDGPLTTAPLGTPHLSVGTAAIHFSPDDASWPVGVSCPPSGQGRCKQAIASEVANPKRVRFAPGPLAGACCTTDGHPVEEDRARFARRDRTVIKPDGFTHNNVRVIEALLDTVCQPSILRLKRRLKAVGNSSATRRGPQKTKG